MKAKQTKEQYTIEFKQEAIKLVKSGQSVKHVATTLGMPHQTLDNWLRADNSCKLSGAGDRVVTPEQMELARLRAENTRLKMERDILKKRQRTLPKIICKVRLDSAQSPLLAYISHVSCARCQ